MAKSIKFGDDTYLDISGMTVRGKTINSLMSASLGSFNANSAKEFITAVMDEIISQNLYFFFGSAVWVGQDMYSIFYVDNGTNARNAIFINSYGSYLVRRFPAGSTGIYKITTTSV